uniref:Uncharacterized protein n=1 Tax=Rhizophora mucronata TaxID=61149 RepID=A0A2P2PVE6_RHIMU
MPQDLMLFYLQLSTWFSHMHKR